MASLFKRDSSKYWYASWRNGEKKKLVSTKVLIKGSVISGIKESPSQARTRAQVIADGYEAADKEGEHAARVKVTLSSLANSMSSSSVSVREYLNKYLENMESQLSRGSIINTKTAFKHLFAHLGKRADSPINGVRRSDAKAFVNEQIKSVRHGTVKKYIGSISPAFMAAMDEELIDKNPFFRLKIPESAVLEDVNKEAFSVSEVKKMMEVLPSEWRSMVICCVYMGGQRLGDLATLTWEQIDMKSGIIVLKTSKTGRGMRIPIIEPLKKHLKSLHRSSEYVHPVTAEKYGRNGAGYISQQFRKELEYAGIIPKLESIKGSRARTVSPKTFHCLRATAATLLHTSGVDSALAREVVGHDSEAVHQLYIRPDDDQRRAALEKLADAME
ncbi:MAG: tyrosine-type recombinase/integrase [Akkermansia sp.]